jgi:hypothetical protein
MAPLPIDYASSPLGSLAGEAHLQRPFNETQPAAIIRVKNCSDEVKRKIVIEAVSFLSGGELSIAKGPYKGKNVTEETLQKRAAAGRNVNWEEFKIVPQPVALKIDGRVIQLHPGEEKIVPEGLWDLYCGNWDRMHSTDEKERTNELERLLNRGLNRFVMTEGNPYGFLQFTREPIELENRVIDRNHPLPSGMIEI